MFTSFFPKQGRLVALFTSIIIERTFFLCTYDFTMLLFGSVVMLSLLFVRIWVRVLLFIWQLARNDMFFLKYTQLVPVKYFPSSLDRSTVLPCICWLWPVLFWNKISFNPEDFFLLSYGCILFDSYFHSIFNILFISFLYKIQVRDVRLIMDRNSWRSKGVGYVSNFLNFSLDTARIWCTDVIVNCLS